MILRFSFLISLLTFTPHVFAQDSISEEIPHVTETIDPDILDDTESSSPIKSYRVKRTPPQRTTHPTSNSENLPAGYLYCPATEETERIVVPLQNTYVVMDITPGLAETTLVQEFTNTTDSLLEATYLFPLPTNATITNMELHFNNRIVSSKVQEKAQARATYEAAKAAGKKTALIEHHRHDIFNTAVANFKPGETVAIHISYVEDIPYESDGYSIRFPLVAKDLYFPKTIEPEAVPLKRISSKRINAPQLPSYSPPTSIEYNPAFSPQHTTLFDIRVSGIPVESIQSHSHDLIVEPQGLTYSISLPDPLNISNQDLHLKIKTLETDSTHTTIVSSQSNGVDYGLLTLFPPKNLSQDQGEPTPKDVIFLIDHSGSMDGERMKNTRKGVASSLLKLNPKDRFNIVIFDDTYESYSSSFVPATSEEITKARSYINLIKAEGGTVMQPALQDSIRRFPNEVGRSEIIVFFGDGYLGDEKVPPFNTRK